MINLVKAFIGIQSMVFTLNEKLPCDTTCYTPVIKFEHIITQERVYFTTNDLSFWTGRYNFFGVELVQPNQVDVLDGKIYLENLGMYFYTIYLQECSVVGIDPNQLNIELERGYMYLRENN
jgi:hypothetical protein